MLSRIDASIQLKRRSRKDQAIKYTMDELESPPTAHTLRPHHISLLMVIMLLYRHYPRKRFHPSFLIQVHGVLLEEIVELTPPRSFPKFLEALKAAPHSDDQGATPFFESLKPEYMDFVSVDHMTNFFHGLPDHFKSLSRLDESFRCILPVRGPQKWRGGRYREALSRPR
ncbi:hypothetical protein EDB86DRAFT_501225 [Lactarius hatsudake]|nr:hypothetical protein EDB86DRAFT_501225 [Lactarius hatsudake]